MKRLAPRLTTGITDSCGAAALNWKLIDLAASHLLLFFCFFPSGCFHFKGGRTVANGRVFRKSAQANACVRKIFAWRMHPLHMETPATCCTSYLSFMSRGLSLLYLLPPPPPQPPPASTSSRRKQKGRVRGAGSCSCQDGCTLSFCAAFRLCLPSERRDISCRLLVNTEFFIFFFLETYPDPGGKA